MHGCRQTSRWVDPLSSLKLRDRRQLQKSIRTVHKELLSVGGQISTVDIRQNGTIRIDHVMESGSLC